MNLFADSSALAKRYIADEQSEELAEFSDGRQLVGSTGFWN